MKTHIGAVISRMNFVQAKTATNQEKMKAGWEDMKAASKSSQETVEARMNA
jgi:hypothetical protein